MAYTKTNWVNDSAPAINATNLNKIETGISDNADALDKIGTVVDAYLTAAKSVASGTWTNVCSVTLSAGVWILTAKANFQSNSEGGRYLSIQSSSGTHVTEVSVPGAALSPHTVKCTKIYNQTSASQTYYFAIYQNCGSAMSIAAGSANGANSLRAVRIK